jgi:pimeloyl-ACP methyl ester carboxylesterase
VFAVDAMRDAGRSVTNVQDGRGLRTSEELMSWLGEVIDDLGLESVSLCGHSYGGQIALAYALHAPHRVRRLVLLGPDDVLCRHEPALSVARTKLIQDRQHGEGRRSWVPCCTGHRTSATPSGHWSRR